MIRNHHCIFADTTATTSRLNVVVISMRDLLSEILFRQPKMDKIHIINLKT